MTDCAKRSKNGQMPFTIPAAPQQVPRFPARNFLLKVKAWASSLSVSALSSVMPRTA
jgi:hypothetical protein